MGGRNLWKDHQKNPKNQFLPKEHKLSANTYGCQISLKLMNLINYLNFIVNGWSWVEVSVIIVAWTCGQAGSQDNISGANKGRKVKVGVQGQLRFRGAI